MKKKNNVLVLTYWSYKDPLVQAYTLPYVRIIRNVLPSDSRVFLATFDQPHQLLTKEERENAIQSATKEGIDLEIFSYIKFNILAPIRLLGMIFRLWYLIISKNIHTIHAWCMPAGSLGYVLSILTGRRLIIDSYEPQAEAMVENRTWEKESLKFKIQFYFERKLSQHAKTIVSATAGMKEYAQRRYETQFDRFYVKPACVDLKEFELKSKKNEALLSQNNLTGKIVCVYAGKFGGIYLTTEVFALFAEAEKFWGDKFRVLLLTNHNENDLKEWSASAGFDYGKVVRKFVAHSEIPRFIGLGDFAITPVKPIPTKRYCTPIKDGEYWAMGLPVVITNDISDDSEIIEKNEIGYVLKNFSEDEYKKCILTINKLLDEKNIEAKIRNIAIQYRSYEIAKSIYQEIYG